MKLETEFWALRPGKEEEADFRIKRLLDEISAFGNIKSNQALWVEQGCDCVYVESSFGIPSSGEKIHCTEMPSVIQKWLESATGSSLLWLDKEDDDEERSDKLLRVVIEDFNGDPALRIRVKDNGDEVDEEICFVVADPQFKESPKPKAKKAKAKKTSKK